ncbi:MAG TPA: hydroxysqualene dehydroxylase HpnE [Rhizomicrobium sp.]|nr:hydroxysqualene dehydroxylase HpnE [Rhizomicrobium sp.]
MTNGKIYVVGAGLAGLSAAVALANEGRPVEVFESAGQAGGRCRSYFDATLGMTIDNGNHLVLSGNASTMKYLKDIGAEHALAGPDNANASFADLNTGARWTIEPSDGPIPFWLFQKGKRVPGTQPLDYIELARLLSAKPDRTLGETLTCKGPLWDRLLEPFFLAALNTKPETGSAALAAQLVRETFARGGRAFRPRIAHPTLAAAFIEPALAYLAEHSASVRLGERVKRIVFDTHRALALEVADRVVALGESDAVVIATPPWATAELVPGTTVPDEFSAIVNAHFKIAPPKDAPGMLGLIGGTAEWVFAFPDRISVTVSGADAIVDKSREELADLLWRDVAKAHALPAALPLWQIVKEKRATFAATPAQVKKRARAETNWRNLVLAGDWTDTGLPATIEGAIRSGNRAAELALARRAV